MLLHRAPGETRLPKDTFTKRFESFAAGRSLDLVNASRTQRGGARPARGPNEEGRAVRAQTLVALGELSAARQALEGADLAPGDADTLSK